ncbi:transposase [Peptoniphilus vaginalis]|uniref:transposase n=1 Tax=Peptoniphilus vaginalis TaxID=1756987 RepID=UPI003C6E7E00
MIVCNFAKPLQDFSEIYLIKYLKEFRSCVTSFNKWFDEICNSLDYPWSNGLLEGTHTKIKTLKRNCFSMKIFNLFKKRNMFAFKWL